MRNSVAAWQLLQRLNQPEAGIIFNHEGGRYHLLLHCQVKEPIDRRSLEQLTGSGFLRRMISAIPVYCITDKGREALRARNVPEELVIHDSDVNSGLRI